MSLMKKAIGGSIHRIREFELEKVNLIDEFDILQIVGEGWFGKILLTEHRSTQTEMVLKALPKAYTGITDFYREFHFGLHLSAHRNIITTYDVAFETAGFYIFSQEYAPLGDLTSNVTETGLGELHAKRVAKQLAAAVHHIHSRELVHRDIKLDNILIFRSDFSRIKLCDFGETRRTNTTVRRHNEWLPYSPPEVLQIETDETYKAATSHDVWQFGIVLFVCLTGCIPWQKATTDDRRYMRYVNWHTATLHIAKKPKLFQLISSRAQRMFKRLLEPKLEKRPVSVLEINKYLEDRWLARLGAEKALTGGTDERDELSPSMYSFHSSLEEKNQLLYTLTQYGIETTVDRTRKKDRIREWIQSSAIAEENEEESDIENSEKLNSVTEIDENSRMERRHFPETLQSIRIVEPSPIKSMLTSRTPTVDSQTGHTEGSEQKKNGKNHRTNTILNSNRRAARSLNHMQRKSPFTPQVTQERHTIAHFASFPNGDPNLANSNEQSSNTSMDAFELLKFQNELLGDEKSLMASKTREQDGLNEMLTSPINKITIDENIRHENSAACSDAIINESKIIKDQPTSRDDKTHDQNVYQPGNKLIMTSKQHQPTLETPLVPTRKHRSSQAPFFISISAQRQLNDNNPTNNTAKTVSQERVLTAVMPTSSSFVTTKLPDPILLRNNKNCNNSNNEDINDSNKSTIDNDHNPLTMTIASHLVMQSFNALQVLNTVPVGTITTYKPSSQSTSPVHVMNSVSDTPHHPDEAGVCTFRKDIYEHYSTAQQTVGTDRYDSKRQGSAGSSTRSISS